MSVLGAAGRGARARLAILIVFVVAFTALQMHALRQNSATFDEPVHLAAGYAALHGDYRVDPSHPPLIRMWAALPALWHAAPFDRSEIDRFASDLWIEQLTVSASRTFSADPDADRTLDASRLMIVVCGLVLGVLLFAWADAWLGVWPAAAALALYTCEPNIAAHTSLVTTDAGEACFFFGAVYFLWRIARHDSLGNRAGVAIFSALAFTTKFSAVLLVPTFAILLVAMRRYGWLRRARIGGIPALAVFAGIWAVYGFRYTPSASPFWTFSLERFAGTGALGGMIAGGARWIDAHHLLPNAYTEGFVFSIGSARMLPSYLMGRYSATGWWYYFPVAVLLKTPVTLIALAAAGVGLLARRLWRHQQTLDAVFVGVPIVVLMAGAMASGINLGVRHVLPIYPFAILFAAFAIRVLLDGDGAWRPGLAVALTCCAALEFATAYPETIGFFSPLAGGTPSARAYLTDSNVDWGQDLKRLKTWMDDHGVHRVNLAYFGSVDPKAYGIHCTFLPGAPLFVRGQIRRPTLPGYVAISATVLNGVYLPPRWRLHYAPFKRVRPVATIGSSILVYRIDRWPEAPRLGEVRFAAGRDPEVLGRLADSLMGQKWYDRAALYYRRYLRLRPSNPVALGNLGVALMMTGAKDEALKAFHAAERAAPQDPAAQKNLALALLQLNRVDEAVKHAQRAVELAPTDAGAASLMAMALDAQRSASVTTDSNRTPPRHHHAHRPETIMRDDQRSWDDHWWPTETMRF